LHGFKRRFSLGGVLGRGAGPFVGMPHGGELAIRGFHGADVGAGLDAENVVELAPASRVAVFDGVIS